MVEAKSSASQPPNRRPFRKVVISPWEVHACPRFAKAVLDLDLKDVADLRDLVRRFPSRSRGRSETAILEIQDSESRFHLRPCRHGGALARWTGGRLANLDRPLDELRTTALLWAQNVPVPEPAFVMGRKVGVFWEAAISTVHCEKSVDGALFLSENPNPAELSLAAESAGEAIRKFHDAGCRHADLHIKNLLFRKTEPSTAYGVGVETTVIDLDGARLLDAISPARRMREIMRLYRSLVKRHFFAASDPSICATFFSAYTANDRELRDALLARLAREQCRVRAHSIFYHPRD